MAALLPSVAAPHAPPAPAPPVPVAPTRRMFVRLETKGEGPTVVSYKKLCRDAEEAARQQDDGAPSSGGVAAALASVHPDGASADVPAAVPLALESDEEDSEGGSEEDEEHEPGSDEEDSQGDDDGSRQAAGGDWYDVDDGFIDDSELLDGPEDAGKAKRNGFFINKGEIERDEVAPPPLVSPAPAKKRKKSEGAQSSGAHARFAVPLEGGGLGGAPGGSGELGDGKKPKPAPVLFQNTGPLADAIKELEEIVKQAPVPPADQKRKFMTPAMLDGLDKIKRIIAVHRELPRGLTTKLMEFMEPFAGISTLRRRLGQDREEEDKQQLLSPAVPQPTAQPIAPAIAAVVPLSAPVAGIVPAAHVPAQKAQRPVPTPAQVEADLARLRAAVRARCALLQEGAAGGEQPAGASADGAEPEPSFKWDRECEEALHVVVQNGQLVPCGKHKSVFQNVLGMNIWEPGMVDVKSLQLANTRVIKRRERAAGASGGGKAKKATATPAPRASPGMPAGPLA